MLVCLAMYATAGAHFGLSISRQFIDNGIAEDAQDQVADCLQNLAFGSPCAFDKALEKELSVGVPTQVKTDCLPSILLTTSVGHNDVIIQI